MTLFENKKLYKEGAINKWEYIDEMYKIHSNLFDYAEFIKETDIAKIEIVEGSVIMTFKSTGVKLLCAQGDKRIASIDVLNFNSYEQSELSMQLKLIQGKSNIFDIGANYGWYSINMARALPNIKIFSFEPIPYTFEYLNKNISINNVSNIQTYNFGFSNQEGEFLLYYDPKLSVNASLVNVSENGGVEAVSCKITTLDNFLSATSDKVDFIKCDVEGAELLVFQGAKQIIERDIPIIFTEMLRKWTAKFNYTPNDIIAHFKSLGYGCFVIRENHLRHFFSVDESTMDTNYFFLHQQKHQEKIKELVK